MFQEDRKKTTEIQSFVCGACGARSRRESAKFCLICGKLLHEGYQPLDRLRSSYRLQGTSLAFVAGESTEVVNLFEENHNTISETAWACLVYSLVPYLGIVFIPFTILIGALGVYAARRQPQIGGRNLAAKSVLASFAVLALQLLLWWLLYKIPEIGVPV